MDGYTNRNNNPEDGEAVGCRGVAKHRTAPNTNNPAAMLDVADCPSKSPPRLITERMDTYQDGNGPTKVVLGDRSGGAMTLGSSLNNCNTLLSSSISLSAFNTDPLPNLCIE